MPIISFTSSLYPYIVKMSDTPPTSPPAKKLKRDSSDSDEDLVDNATQKALEEIDSCQNLLDALSEKASEAILKVDKKYTNKRKPWFDLRGSLLKRLPNFWVTVVSLFEMLRSS